MSNDNQYDQPIAGHEYDGIQEFDNPLPMWWLWTFFGTIIFSFLYWVHYEMGGGPSLAQELSAEMAVIEKMQQSAPQKEYSGEELMAMMSDTSRLSVGQQIYVGKCASCHGEQGQGSVGSNLVDKYWIHGEGKPEEILSVIRLGVLDKGMPPWGGILKADELISVTAYVRSLKGKKVSGGKGPEGKEVPSYF